MVRSPNSCPRPKRWRAGTSTSRRPFKDSRFVNSNPQANLYVLSARQLGNLTGMMVMITVIMGSSYTPNPWYFGAVGMCRRRISTGDWHERPREPPDRFSCTITVVEKLGPTSSLTVQQVLPLQMKTVYVLISRTVSARFHGLRCCKFQGSRNAMQNASR